MTNELKNILLFSASVLVLGGGGAIASLSMQEASTAPSPVDSVKGRVEPKRLCDAVPCPPCELEDKEPRIPECPTASGWLCCNDELTVCGPGNGDGSCPGIDYWCDYYETDASGFSVCYDLWGQGLVIDTETGKEIALQ